MPPQILDSHTHLWPSTATSPTSHTWMTPSHPLAKLHSTTSYKAAASHSPTPPSAFIYVETDRHLPSPSPAISPSAPRDEVRRELSVWAKAPLEELAFLRRLVSGNVEEGDGAESGDGELMRGVVIWAPFHLPTSIFDIYLELAEEVLGEAWGRVVGFRYLLQGRKEEEVRRLVQGEWFGGNVRGVCKGEEGRRRAFDVGIDAHGGGVGTLEAVGGLVEGGGVFVLDHLCKPDFSTPEWDGFDRWKAVMTRMASRPDVYVKLSGALNEFSPSPTPASAEEILSRMRPYLDHVYQSFGAERIMFGSDWPVCNVGGPKGEQGNWAYWTEVVGKWMEEKEMSEGEREDIWGKTAVRAYGVEGF